MKKPHSYEAGFILPGLLLLACGVLWLRENRASTLEKEVSELQRQLSLLKHHSLERNRSLRTVPIKRVPPQPPFPLSELDRERQTALSKHAWRHHVSRETRVGEPHAEEQWDGVHTRLKLVPGAAYSVPKTVFSDDQRLVFFAGIEGTGHHFWTAVFEDPLVGALATPDPHEFGPSGELWQLTKLGPELCNKGCGATPDAVPPPKDIHSPRVLAKAVGDLVGKLAAERAQVAGTTTATTVVPLNAWKSRGTIRSDGKFAKKGKASLVPPESRFGMMSYPNWWEPDKTLKHPNLRVLAEACEHGVHGADAGGAGQADLRIVVLLRNSKDVLTSTAVKRVDSPGFSIPMGKEAAILADNTAVLLAQLQLLDPSFFICVEMDALNQSSFDRVGEFIGIKPPPPSPSQREGHRHPWSLDALVERGLALPKQREPGRGFERDLAGLTRHAVSAHDSEKAGSGQRGSEEALAEGFEPFTENQASSFLADLMAMELLFRRKICGL